MYDGTNPQLVGMDINFLEQVLDALNIRAGEQFLIHGSGGVTGGLLVAFGLLRGAQVIATAGPASHRRVSALGAYRLPRSRMARTGQR
jgi:NADPH:quinone reductase-like Zn-dependent oxidoreductase